MEVRHGLGDQGDPAAGRQVQAHQLAGQVDGVLAQLGIGQGGVELAAHAVEVQAGPAARRVVQALGQGLEIAQAEGQVPVDGRGRRQGQDDGAFLELLLRDDLDGGID